MDSDWREISRETCAYASDPEKIFECSVTVQSVVRREIESAVLGTVVECVRDRCDDAILSGQIENRRHARVTIDDVSFVVGASNVGSAPHHVIRHCGSWRPGMTVFASAVSSLDPSSGSVWVEISGRASSSRRDETEQHRRLQFRHDDVSYFASIAASHDSSVHVFEPDPTHIMRTLSMMRLNALSNDVTVHPAYAKTTTTGRTSNGEEGVHMCIGNDECDATLTAIQTTLDRALLPALYRGKGSTLSRVRWIQMRVQSHQEALDILNGARKLMGLRWIEFVMIDRRSAVDMRQDDDDASVKLQRALERSGLAMYCVDNTTLAMDVGVVDESAFVDVAERFASGSLDNRVVGCDSLLVARDVNLMKDALAKAVEIATVVERDHERVLDLNALESSIVRDVEARKEVAESMWHSGEGYVWLQHVRQGGGEVLCRQFRMNNGATSASKNNVTSLSGDLVRLGRGDERRDAQNISVVAKVATSISKGHIVDCLSENEHEGVVRTSIERADVSLSKQTCDRPFRSSCDVHPHDTDLMSIVVDRDTSELERQMQDSNRNVVEQQFGPIPASLILSATQQTGHDDRWRRWVFVTSMRDPLDRALSLLHNEPTLCNENIEKGARCPYATMFRPDVAKAHCAKRGSANCYSNHFTRTLSGRYGDEDISESDLMTAKLMLHRTSCVLIVEEKKRSAGCLDNVLGLRHFDLSSADNAAWIEERSLRGDIDDARSTLSPAELSLLMDLNALDMELWDFALRLLDTRGYYAFESPREMW